MIKISWPEISEAHADGDIAKLYEEIRAVTGIPLVNLIYRHIATIRGGLSWTWGALRSLYESNAAVALGMTVVKNAHLPILPQVPEVYFAAAGLHSNDLDEIARILDFYIRGNAMNLLAMSSLCQLVDEGTRQSTCLSRYNISPNPKCSDQAIRPILQMDALDEKTHELVTRLNKLGEGTMPDSVSPSLFRHLAYWPIFLSLAGIYLLPVDVDGSIARGAETIRDRAMSEAAKIVNSLTRPRRSGIGPDAVVEIRGAASHFAELTIPRLLSICLLLRRSLPRRPDAIVSVAMQRTT